MIKVIEKENGLKFFEILKEGYKLTLCNVGASIYDIETPDKNGLFESVVLSPKDPFINEAYFGSTVGRNAGRIKNGKFVLNGKTFSLPLNDGCNNTHTSGKGVSHRIMTSEIVGDKVIFSINSLSSEDHFPGDIKINVAYSFEDFAFKVEYNATPTRDTLCNITNHTYFNLSGNLKRDIVGHALDFTDFINYWDLDNTNVPLAERFIETPSIKGFIEKYKDRPQRGIDHPFRTKNSKIHLEEKQSGRHLEISSSYEHVVLYSQNWELDELNSKVNQGLAIEFQYLPNDININGSDSKTILKKNEEYNEWIRFNFK